MAKSAKLRIAIDAETRAFLRKFRNVKRMVSQTATVLAGTGIATAAAMVYATKKAAEYGDSIGKMARRTGLGVENLQQLKHAAELSGTDMEALEKGTRRLQKNIYDFGRGLSTSSDAFAALGISMGDINGLNTDEQLNLVMSALAGVSDTAKQAGIAQDLFGRSGTKLLPMLKGGKYELARMKQEAVDLGIVMSADAVQAAEDFQDSLLRLKSSFGAASRQFGAAAFRGGIDAMDNMRTAITGMIESGALDRIGVAAGNLAGTLSELAADPDNIEAMVQLLEGASVAMSGLAEGTAKTIRGLGWVGEKLYLINEQLGKLRLRESGEEQIQKGVIQAGGGDLELQAARSLKRRGIDIQRTDQGFWALLHDEMRRMRELQEARLPAAS